MTNKQQDSWSYSCIVLILFLDVGCSKQNWQNVTLLQAWIYTDQRQNSHRKAWGISSGVFFFVVIRRGKNLDGWRFSIPSALWLQLGRFAPAEHLGSTHTSLLQKHECIKGRKSSNNWGWQKNMYWSRSMKWQMKVSQPAWFSRILHFSLFQSFLGYDALTGTHRKKEEKNTLARFFLAAPRSLSNNSSKPSGFPLR